MSSAQQDSGAESRASIGRVAGLARLPEWLEWVAWGAAAISLAVYVGFATNGFWGDDWELWAQALRGGSLTDPISSHMRPLVRAFFFLFHWTSSSIAFHLLSILLHLFTAGAAYALTRQLYGAQIGRLSALLFVAAFPANEAVYWTSAVGVVVCLLFVLLALRCWALERPLRAALCLVPAALSYELWLVALPLFFLMRRGRLRDWLLPGATFGLFVLAYLRAFGWGGASAYGGLKWTALPERLATYAYHLADPSAAAVGTVLSLALLVALVAAALWVPTLRFPVVFYLSSAALLSVAESEGMVSRFCYFPQLALVLFLLLLKDTGKVGKWIGISLASYVLAVSPLWNFVDGRDYRNLARFYSQVAESTKPALATAAPGDSFGFLNRTTPAALLAVVQSSRGRPKAQFVRGNALHGAVYLQDAATIELHARGLALEETEACAGRRLEFGRGEPVARYCFKVIDY